MKDLTNIVLSDEDAKAYQIKGAANPLRSATAADGQAVFDKFPHELRRRLNLLAEDCSENFKEVLGKISAGDENVELLLGTTVKSNTVLMARSEATASEAEYIKLDIPHGYYIYSAEITATAAVPKSFLYLAFGSESDSPNDLLLEDFSLPSLGKDSTLTLDVFTSSAILTAADGTSEKLDISDEIFASLSGTRYAYAESESGNDFTVTFYLIKPAKAYADEVANAAEENAKKYTDDTSANILNDAKGYADDAANAAEENANGYTDNQTNAVLSDAKAYTDEQAGTLVKKGKNSIYGVQGFTRIVLPSVTSFNPSDTGENSFYIGLGKPEEVLETWWARTEEGKTLIFDITNIEPNIVIVVDETTGKETTREATEAERELLANMEKCNYLNSDYGCTFYYYNETKAYADNAANAAETNANGYTDNQTNAALSDAKAYTDNSIGDLTVTVQGDFFNEPFYVESGVAITEIVIEPSFEDIPQNTITVNLCKKEENSDPQRLYSASLGSGFSNGSKIVIDAKNRVTTHYLPSGEPLGIEVPDEFYEMMLSEEANYVNINDLYAMWYNCSITYNASIKEFVETSIKSAIIDSWEVAV